MREKFGDAILATTAVRRMMAKRLQSVARQEEEFSKNVFLLHQFKREEEIALLRSVYGRLFFQVSVYSRQGARVDYLARKFASSRNIAAAHKFRPEAEALIQADENEAENPHGQRVGKIFHDADLIISVDAVESVDEQVNRFCELIFGSNSLSPSRSEYGMFLAKAAALRTLDLSRQVGAAIFSHTGEILALGSNEVPKACGGTYWAGEKFDDRDYVRKIDSNFQRKRELLGELIGIIAPSAELDSLLSSSRIKDSQLMKLELAGERKREMLAEIVGIIVPELDLDVVISNPKIRESQFMDALEYGRIVHAEMSALSDAARVGHAVNGGTLYCTTFPCHMCAKHIVAAGIMKVVFLEPYPKSLAKDLHSDSIEVEGGDRGRYKEYPAVKFEHFFGVSPRRYREIFARDERKNKETGIFIDYVAGEPVPIIDVKYPFYNELEKFITDRAMKEMCAVVDEQELSQI